MGLAPDHPVQVFVFDKLSQIRYNKTVIFDTILRPDK